MEKSAPFASVAPVTRWLAIGILSAAIAAVLLHVSPATAAERKPRVTIIGDSVQASFSYVPKAVSRLGKGLDLKVDAVVCRRLISSSCTYNGVTPKTALQVIQSKGPALGSVVVMNVGYNEASGTYDVSAVMRALRKAKVKSVVWVTLREKRSVYTAINGRIRQAAGRWKGSGRRWHAASSGKPWFGSDGLHLNSAGAFALSGLIRQKVSPPPDAPLRRAARRTSRWTAVPGLYEDRGDVGVGEGASPVPGTSSAAASRPGRRRASTAQAASLPPERGQPPPFRPESPPAGLHWDRSTDWPSAPAVDATGGERRELVFAIRLEAGQLVGLDLEATRDRVLGRVRQADPGALCWCAADDRGGWLIVAVLAPANMWSVALAAVQDAFPGHEVLSRQ